MMNDLFEKSMETLELPKVLELLAAEAVTAEGKERCRALRPMTHADDVKRALEETTAALNLLTLRGGPALSGVRPVVHSLERAARGGSLNPRELLDIAGVLSAARSAREYAADSGEKTVLSPLFANLTANRFLEEKITGSILSEEEIADSASTELADIRRHIRAASAKVRDVLNKLLSSSQAKYLQEAIITQRNDRYVVPVRAECKNDVPGLVHDVSSSGATFFIEPMGVVQANNQLRELAAREKKEIDRILAALSGECASFQEDIRMDYDLLILIDCVFARAKYSSRIGGMEPKLSTKGLSLRRARHPLLDPKKAVANDFSLGMDFDTLVITGPNTGGKTVTLKTMGLLTLMAQCGLHIPAADDSEIRVYQRILADIGDEQSIAQSLSTFSSHMVNIVGILEVTDRDTLILFDELGAGTDPVEGAALAAAIIESARGLGASVAATTHYAELKVYAMTTDGVENASCEFDVDSLAPTYRLLIGIPGKSNAFAISQRLGLPGYIIDRAAARLDAENVRFEDVLTQLDRQRQEMEREKDAARVLRLEMEENAREAREYRQKLEEERRKVRETAAAQARAILDEARDTADRTFRELDRMRRQQEKEGRDADWQSVNDRRADLRRQLNEADAALGARPEQEAPPKVRDAVAGDTVELLSMGVQGTVLSVNKDGMLQIQAGILKVTVRQEDVRVTEGESGGKKQAKEIVRRAEHTLRTLKASPEVDLRGMMTDEAIAALDLFLDNALMAHLEQVVVIHGKGTGAVRAAVRSHLKRSRYVKEFRPGQYGEGEDGVTVVTLK